jgi:hypothetical protein
MTSAAQSVLPLLNSLPMRDRLDIAAHLKRGLISDERMTATDRKLLKQSLALKPKQRQFLADILSILNHPTDDTAEKLLQEILRMTIACVSRLAGDWMNPCHKKSPSR